MACATCSTTLGALLREDFGHGRGLARHVVGLALLDPIGLIALYRIEHAVYRSPFHGLAWLLKEITGVLYSIDLHPGACLGRRVGFAHTVGVIIGGGIVAGDDLVVYGNVTLGAGRDGVWPTIGHRVTVGTGACVAGPARLGNDVRIGANAYVAIEVPDGRLAVGVPARVVSPQPA